MVDFNNIKRGAKLRLLTHFGVGRTVGDVATVTSVQPNQQYANVKTTGYNHSFTVCREQVELVAQTVEELEKELSTRKRAVTEAKKQVKETEDKIKYLKDNDLKEYDELQFKSYQTLQLLKDGDKDDLEKSKILAALIRGE